MRIIEAAGAPIVAGPEEVFYRRRSWSSRSRSPRNPEFDLLREGQILFTFLHLAANRELTLELRQAQGHRRGLRDG